MRKSLFVASLGAAVLTMGLASSSNAAPIVTNGDFQTTPTQGSYGTGSTGISGWTVTGSGGVEQYNGGFGFPTWNVQLNPAPWTGSGGVQQTLTTVSGQSYQIDIDFGARAENANQTAQAILTFGTQTFNMIDSAGSPKASVFTHYTFTPTASSASTLLKIVAAPYDGGTSTGSATWKGVIDNVAVVAVPEPASLGLLSLGGLALLRRRRSVRA